MIDVALVEIVGFTSLGLLVIGWLVVSFLAPGKTRSRVARVAATCMFLALLCLFVHWFQGALRKEDMLEMIAFGFLSAIFTGGLVVSIFKAVGEFIGRGSASPH